MTVKEMKIKTKELTAENEALDEQVAPMRGKTVFVSKEEQVKVENAFIKMVEEWTSRKRKFKDAFETVRVGFPSRAELVSFCSTLA